MKRNLPAKRAPRQVYSESFRVNHDLDTPASPDDYIAAIVGRATIAAGLRLLGAIAAPPTETQPDPRTPGTRGLYIPSLRDMFGPRGVR